MPWEWEKDRVFIARDGSEHRRAGFLGCLCGWEAALGTQARREFDKHLARVLGSG